MENIFMHLPGFLLVLCRISSFFIVAPVLSFRGVPMIFKISTASFISLLTYFSIVGLQTGIMIDGAYLLAVTKEVLIGLTLGFVSYLFFTVVQIAGSFVDLQMGFGIVNVMDPVTGAQSPILGSFKFMVATLVFLAVDGHHFLLKAVIDSYEWVPLHTEAFIQYYDGSIASFLTASIGKIFILAFQIAAPLIVTLFLTDIALGMLARTAPQFNVFVIGIPIKILLGFFVVFLMIGGLLYLFRQLFITLFQALYEWMDLFSL